MAEYRVGRDLVRKNRETFRGRQTLLRSLTITVDGWFINQETAVVIRTRSGTARFLGILRRGLIASHW